MRLVTYFLKDKFASHSLFQWLAPIMRKTICRVDTHSTVARSGRYLEEFPLPVLWDEAQRIADSESFVLKRTVGNWDIFTLSEIQIALHSIF